MAVLTDDLDANGIGRNRQPTPVGATWSGYLNRILESISAKLTPGNLARRTMAGQLTITPTAANVPTVVHVTFAVPFASTPIVVAGFQSSSAAVQQVSATNVTPQGFDMSFMRANTTATGCSWIATTSAQAL